ncbi:hypothetical protein [Lapillicoccus sp.]|uniref:hypothetical protein n=1 Tax=Lapillicoccus sp. TaxID=1909287 RepID=UPI0039837A48
MRRSVAAVGRASVGQVWERYAVLADWSSWSPPIRRVEASGARLVAGLTGVVHGPPGVRIPFVVDAVDEVAHTWSWHVSVGVLRVDLEHEVLATSAGGSAATLVVDGPLPVALLYPEVARIALTRLVAG